MGRLIDTGNKHNNVIKKLVEMATGRREREGGQQQDRAERCMALFTARCLYIADLFYSGLLS